MNSLLYALKVLVLTSLAAGALVGIAATIDIASAPRLQLEASR